MADIPTPAPQPNDNKKYVIDLRTRFGSAFGESLARIAESALGFGYQVAPNVPGPGSPLLADFIVPAPPEEEDVEYMSPIGTPIYDRFVFSINGTDYQFALPPLVDISLEKRVSATPVNDNDFDLKNVTVGEVVESWGTAAWDITLRGIMVDMINHNRPLDQMKELIDLFKENGVISVYSRLFTAAGISKLYVKRLELPGMEGFKDTQPYIITARSYTDVELILNA